MLDQARRYLAAGISIIPCRLPGKQPHSQLLPMTDDGRPTWTPFRSEIVDIETAKQWFGNGSTAAIGAIAGKVSGGLEIIDFDDRDLLKPWGERVRELDPGLLDALVMTRTYSGNYHVAYRCEVVDGNTKLARGIRDDQEKTLIETRGEGGYAIVPPSEGYTAKKGELHQVRLVTPSQRGLLLSVARSFDEMPAASTAQRTQQQTSTTRPGDDYNGRGDWRAVLQGHGWQQVTAFGNKEGWRRPGKKQGISATWNYDGSGKFYVFSTNASPFDSETGYSPFAVYALLEAGGDFDAAARELAQAGYGENRAMASDRSEPAKESNDDVDSADPVLAEFMLTDTGNAQAFVYQHADRIRYHKPSGQWYQWRGHHWDWCEESYPASLLTATMIERNLAGYKAKLAEDLKDAYLKYTSKNTNRTRLNAALELAKQHKPMEWTRRTELDAKPTLLACPNGVIDLESGQLVDGNREDNITRAIPVEFRTEATAPRWLQFLSEIFDNDQDLIAYVQRAVGYSLSGDTREQCLFFNWGTGRNGKTVFQNTLLKMLGEYGATAQFSTFELVRGDRQTNDLANLRGKRLVVAAESGEGKRLDESRIKQLTGGDTVRCRLLYAQEFEYSPAYKIWLATNHKPTIRGTDYGIWRRIHLVPFEVQFTDQTADKNLQPKLLAELPGILSWAVQGYQEWAQRGLCPPARVTEATNDYRSEMDVLGKFLDECTTPDPLGVEGAAALYKAYKCWAEVNGESPISKTMFGRDLSNRPGIQKRKRTYVEYLGIRLVEG